MEMMFSCHVVAALDRRTPREMNMPDYPHDTYSYFFFNFPHLNVLSDSILNEEFAIPSFMSAMLITSHLGSLRDERAVSTRSGVFASVFGGMA